MALQQLQCKFLIIFILFPQLFRFYATLSKKNEPQVQQVAGRRACTTSLRMCHTEWGHCIYIYHVYAHTSRNMHYIAQHAG